MKRAVLIGCIVVGLVVCIGVVLRTGKEKPGQAREPAALKESGAAAKAERSAGPSRPGGTSGTETPGRTEPGRELPVRFEVPDETSTEGDYKMTIVRKCASRQEAELIRLAESVYPNRDDVVAVAKRDFIKDNAIPAGEKLWWYDVFDDVRVPYAITGDALRYYRDVTLAFRGGDFRSLNNLKMLNSSLEYVARVERHELYKAEGKEFPDATVVTMKLSWSMYCGGACGAFFSKERAVVFSPSGEVLAVLFDGATMVIAA